MDYYWWLLTLPASLYALAGLTIHFGLKEPNDGYHSHTAFKCGREKSMNR